MFIDRKRPLGCGKLAVTLLSILLQPRFAGPATTVEIFCLTVPRIYLRSEGDAVSETGNRFVQIVLHPDQADALHQDQPRVFLCGPPGTGKTVVLTLRALKWLKDGHVVSIVSTWRRSLAASYVIRHQVRQMVGSVAEKNLHLYEMVVSSKEDRKRTIESLATRVDSQGRLFVIADEITGRNFIRSVCMSVLPSHTYP